MSIQFGGFGQKPVQRDASTGTACATIAMQVEHDRVPAGTESGFEILRPESAQSAVTGNLFNR